MCCFRGLEGADAGIDTDDDFNSSRSRTFDDVILDAIAFLDAVRHVEVGSAAAKFNGGFQDHDGGGSVYVIVAVDEDAFVVGDGALRRSTATVMPRIRYGE